MLTFCSSQRPKIYHLSLSLPLSSLTPTIPLSLSVVWQCALAVLGQRGFACKSLSLYVIAICCVPREASVEMWQDLDAKPTCSVDCRGRSKKVDPRQRQRVSDGKKEKWRERQQMKTRLEGEKTKFKEEDWLGDDPTAAGPLCSLNVQQTEVL